LGERNKALRQRTVGLSENFRDSHQVVGDGCESIGTALPVTEELRRRAPGEVSAARLAERFEVSRRTIERDLASLQEAGVPLYASMGRTGGYGLDRRTGRVAVTLSAAEVTALLLALSAAEGMPFADSAEQAAARLLDCLPAETRVHVDQLRSRLRTVPPNPPKPTPRVRMAVEEAVRRSAVVRLAYCDRHGRTSRRDVEAVGFYGGADGWYLVGWCRLRRAGRVFRLDRIINAHVTSEIVPARDVDETLGWVPTPTVMPGPS
jgi:predicted DNA-binding transcriptional regulator YafY